MREFSSLVSSLLREFGILVFGHLGGAGILMLVGLGRLGSALREFASYWPSSGLLVAGFLSLW